MYYLVAYTVLGSALMALAMALSYTFTGITSSPHGVESVASVRTLVLWAIRRDASRHPIGVGSHDMLSSYSCTGWYLVEQDAPRSMSVHYDATGHYVVHCLHRSSPRPLHHVSGRGQLHGVRGPLGLSVSRHSPSLWDSAMVWSPDAVHLDVDH